MPTELEKLTAAGRSDVLPGYTLSPFRLWMYAEAEGEFARSHLATAAAAAVGLPEGLQQRVVDAAMRDVRDGAFNYGSPEFDRKALAHSSTPFPLWLCLRVKHPKITRAQAEALVTPDNEEAVYLGVRELCGYEFGNTLNAPDAKKVPAAGTGGPSAGESSTPPSAPGGSLPDRSPT